jgi:hypothetical protein
VPDRVEQNLSPRRSQRYSGVLNARSRWLRGVRLHRLELTVGAAGVKHWRPNARGLGFGSDGKGSPTPI